MFKIVQRTNLIKLPSLLVSKNFSVFVLSNGTEVSREINFRRYVSTSRRLKVTKFQNHVDRFEEKNLCVVPVKYALNKDQALLQLTWSSGESSLHPLTWLRDNCRCNKCFNSSSMARKILLQSFYVHPEVQSVELNVGNSGDVLVTWKDGHISQWTRDFLLARSFTKARRNRREQCYKSTPKLWGKELMDKGLPTHDYQTIMREPKALLAWLEDIEITGIALINEIPPEKEALKQLLEKVAYPENNNYGEYFEVISKENPSNLAYTPDSLGLHVDLPFYYNPPGIQLLHYLCQTEDVVGGENNFSDGFYCAEKLKEYNPIAYKILTNTLVDFCDYGTDELTDFHMLNQKHVIETDSCGNLKTINFNNQVRDSYLNIPVEDVQLFYEALKLFCDVLYDNTIKIKGYTGQLVAFDNHRVLHGRLEYRCINGIERHLRGTYLRWDETRSRMRRLRSQIRHGFEEDIP